MKTIRTAAAIVLLACAAAAAYLSYTTAFAPPPMHSVSGGPPAGITMPKGDAAAGRKPGSNDHDVSNGGAQPGNPSNDGERRKSR